MSILKGRILLTGATGFIGRRLADRLSAEGYVVVAVGREAVPGPWQDFVEWDIAGSHTVPAEKFGPVDRIYHLASKAHALTERPGETSGYEAVIVGGTRRVLELAEALKARQFIYVSSVKAMGEGQGRSNGPCIDESLPNAPTSPYGVAKAQAEQLVLNAHIPFRAIVRPTMVFGPGQKGNLQRMMDAVRRNRFPPLPEVGNRRSMVHVDDLLAALLRLPDFQAANGRAFIITGKESPSTRQLLDWMRSALGMSAAGKGVPLGFLEAAASLGSAAGRLLGRRMPIDRDTLGKLLGSAWYTSDLAKEVIGYEPVESLPDFIQEMARHA